MDRLGWGKKNGRTGGGKASILRWGSRRSRSCGASCPARSSVVQELQQEVLVYHRRSLSDREEAVERRRAVKEECAVEALGGLGKSEAMGSMILCKLRKKVRKWFPNLLKS
jgi:hypothetical protein